MNITITPDNVYTGIVALKLLETQQDINKLNENKNDGK